MTKDYPWGKGTPKWVRDATANDSDKSFTVPTGKIWDVQQIIIEISCTATVGNRVLIATITDGTNAIFTTARTTNITASQTGVLRTGRHLPTSTTTADGPLLDTSLPNATKVMGLPPLILPSGYIIRCYDLGAIDAAADDMSVSIEYIEYDA